MTVIDINGLSNRFGDVIAVNASISRSRRV